MREIGYYKKVRDESAIIKVISTFKSHIEDALVKTLESGSGNVEQNVHILIPLTNLYGRLENPNANGLVVARGILYLN